MKTLYVVSHTEATHHLDNVVGGWHDSELTEKGLADARLIAERLPKDVQIETIYSSSLKRALSTAKEISKTTGAKVLASDNLREMCFGAAEGKHQSWLNDRICPEDGINRLDHRIVEGAETKREFAGRIYAYLDNVEWGDVSVLSTHSFAATFVLAWWIRMPLEAVGYVNFNITPGKISKLVEDDFFRNRAVEYINR